MTQQGFEHYLFSVFGHKSGTANSYNMAIRIIDELFAHEDVFALEGKSIANIDNMELLTKIAKFVCDQQTLYKKGGSPFFKNVKTSQTSYVSKGFCSAAVNHLVKYYKIMHEADAAIKRIKSGATISQKLAKHFNLGKVGKDVKSIRNERVGQSYFRKMVLENYEEKCCITGLNVPQTLRASHIVAWSEDIRYRMNPENGLCLSATYDAAFDKYLISLDDDYRMIVSRQIREYYTNDVTKEYFNNFEGKQIIMPRFFMPNKKFLAMHRDKLLE